MGIADYGNYVYNGNLFHLNDDGKLNEYERLWDSQIKPGLGEYQIQAESRNLMLLFVSIILFAVGAGSIGVALFDDSYPGGRPLYNIIVLVSIGILLWAMAFAQLTVVNNKIILFERGLVYATCLGLRRRTVFYRDIGQIEKQPHRIKKRRVTLDFYTITAGRKRYMWNSSDFSGAGPMMDLLLARCYVKIN